MGFKERITQYYVNSYIKKYGDRLTQAQGKVISIKIEEKNILKIFYKFKCTLLIKPEQSKNVVTCVFKKNSWFKKPAFIAISQGHLLLIQGVKGKRGEKSKQGIDLREVIEIMNVRNLSTKTDLVPVDGEAKVQKVQKVKQKYR